jgi:hypothetical protein
VHAQNYYSFLSPGACKERGCAYFSRIGALANGIEEHLNAPDANSGGAPKRQFELSIGCVPFRLQMSDAQLFRAASSRYAAFAKSATQPIQITLNEFSKSERESSEFRYEFEGAALHAFSQEARFDGVRNEYALDSLLRVLLSWKLAGRQGFLLHAATVVRAGKAYVFTGRSGAGKSTVASLSPPGTVLTDEISLLRLEAGEWHAYGTPFWGEFRAAGSNTSAPVRGIFRLVQAAENRVIPLRPVEMLRALLPNVLFFSSESEANRRLLEILGHAVDSIPGYELAFRKDPAFWEVLPE